MDVVAMIARLLHGLGQVAWLVSMLIVGGSAALLLTACQSAGPAKVKEAAPAPQVAAAQANRDSSSAMQAVFCHPMCWFQVCPLWASRKLPASGFPIWV
jgi:hypothetical protein